MVSEKGRGLDLSLAILVHDLLHIGWTKKQAVYL